MDFILRNFVLPSFLVLVKQSGDQNCYADIHLQSASWLLLHLCCTIAAHVGMRNDHQNMVTSSDFRSLTAEFGLSCCSPNSLTSVNHRLYEIKGTSSRSLNSFSAR
jgi:hypothetical protein